MPQFQSSSGQDRIDDVINAVFRMSGTLLSSRDQMVRDIGLTSARWQVLAEVSGEPSPMSAAGIARRIGLSRQAVQRTTNELVAAGMVTFSDDPGDRRSRLVAITDRGKAALAKADERQRAWLSRFGNALDGSGLEAAASFLRVADAIAGDLPGPQPGAGRDAQEPEENSPQLPVSPSRPQARKVRAFERVSDFILHQIKGGVLVSGDKLPAERDLAAALSVGRPAVREALRSLEMSGVLRFERGASGGAFVRETGSDGMALSIRTMLILGRLPPFDLNEVRTCILGQAARLGAERGTEADFAALERNIDLIEERGAVDDPMATVPPVIKFYRLVGASSHNPLMIILVDAIADVMHEMLVDLQIRTSIDVITPRRDMLAAMRGRRPDEAERAIRLHFEETGALLLDYRPTTSGGWVRTGSF